MQHLVKHRIRAFSRRIVQARRNGQPVLATRLEGAMLGLIKYLATEHQVRTRIYTDGRVEFRRLAPREVA